MPGRLTEPVPYHFDPKLHVKLPFITIPDSESDWILVKGQKISRWTIITQTLKKLEEQLISSLDNPDDVTQALCDSIRTYNSDFNGNLAILSKAIWKHIPFRQVIQFIIQLVLRTPELFPEPVWLLSGEGNDGMPGSAAPRLSSSYSEEQVCCLLANGFLCTYSNRHETDYPAINFNRLFDNSDQTTSRPSWRSRMGEAKVQKLLCILNYFDRMRRRLVSDYEGTRLVPVRQITFERRVLSAESVPQWEMEMNSSLCDLQPFLDGCIEDSVGSLQVEFANKMVGGGTLGNGCAMEEIRFSCCPELIASQLFTKVLGDNEALIICNFEQFSKPEGYSSSFKFGGNHEDNRACENVVAAIDAYPFPRMRGVELLQIQLQKRWLDRELNKCFVAFNGFKRIASGKWGCGVYNGNPLLKCLIQWMAASIAGADALELYTFGDENLVMTLNRLKATVKMKGCSVAALYNLILIYGEQLGQGNINAIDLSLESFIQNKLWQQNSESGNDSTDTVGVNRKSRLSSCWGYARNRVFRKYRKWLWVGAMSGVILMFSRRLFRLKRIAD